MKFFVAIVQDVDGHVVAGYIVTGGSEEHIRPLYEQHRDNLMHIRVMDGPTEVIVWTHQDF